MSDLTLRNMSASNEDSVSDRKEDNMSHASVEGNVSDPIENVSEHDDKTNDSDDGEDNAPDDEEDMQGPLAGKAAITEIKELIDKAEAESTFAIGGQVSIQDPRSNDHQQDSSPSHDGPSCDPIQLRFGEDGKGIKLVLPATDTPSDKMDALIAACTPATFGRNGEDVLDESYRKAGKLDTTDFLTDFCPYKSGIVAIVSQALFVPPSWERKGGRYYDHWVQRPPRGIRAELYKLNVYSGPSGHFKPHVDTPRAENQFGSLVVALPVAHSGGQLLVRHGARKLTFDFAGNTTGGPPTLQWAAFYSDCEHEVLPVTSGHRITLTYNLYTTTVTAGILAGLNPSAFDATQHPLYKTMRKALQQSTFYPGGRVLALRLSHHYAHTSQADCFLPESLKGSDMIMYEICQALGLAVHIRPTWIRPCGNASSYRLPNQMGAAFAAMSETDDESTASHARDLCEKTKVPKTWERRARISVTHTTWLNSLRPTIDPPQLVAIAYGNEASIDLTYSHATMFIRVPPFEQRGQPAQSKWDDDIYRGLRTEAPTAA